MPSTHASTATLPAPADATAWWRPVREPAALGAATPPGSTLAFGALVAFTVILLLSPQALLPLLQPFRIALLAGGLAIAAHVAERTSRREAVTPASPEIAIALTLVGWSIVTLPMSIWPGGSVRVLTEHYLKAVAFFWLLATVVSTGDRLRTMCWTLTLCSIPLSATAVLNYVSGDVLSTGVRGFERIIGYSGSLTTNPNDLALMLNLIIPLAGALAFVARGSRRLVAVAALLLSVSAVVLTYSRAGFLTLAASFVIFLAVLVRRRAPGAAACLLLAALCVPPLLPDNYVARLGTIANIEADATGSAQGRWLDTKVAAGLVARHPILGVGLGQDILALNEERGDTWRRVHNAYLQYGVDLGVPGLLLFVWLHLACFRTARTAERRADGDPALRGLRPLAIGLQISLVAFGVAAMFHPIAYHFYFFCIGGLAVALRNVHRTRRPSMAPVRRAA